LYGAAKRLIHSARVSRAGARTGLQLPGHGDMQGFDSSSLASVDSLIRRIDKLTILTASQELCARSQP
jgi:hypothetical protein